MALLAMALCPQRAAAEMMRRKFNNVSNRRHDDTIMIAQRFSATFGRDLRTEHPIDQHVCVDIFRHWVNSSLKQRPSHQSDVDLAMLCEHPVSRAS
eukprot:2096612-Amphidinium_carterae.1